MEQTVTLGTAMVEEVPWVTWKTATDYQVGDTVYVWGEKFTCVVGHKSDVFGNDLFDKKYWKRGL
ncbi:MAG: hypothetical protein HY457_03305 [Parcubacteria group bacterium]|nr:hypothetical protein [Parcubacteria group bacterium]